ncbi:MAG: protein translocase subunit SecD [Fusobacteriaceae bacterium]|nr:protein translocase subunit SecD [Fusobacteriaceae bacterium]MBN2837172.1 protein translocase subunit SecD [Fusobacteriaceae bacterium]
MKKRLLIEIFVILMVILGAAYYAFRQPTSLGLDLKGGVYVVLQGVPDAGKSIKAEDMKNLSEVLDRRINALGVAEPRISISGTDRIIVELPGVKDPEEAVKVIGKTALLEFQLVKDEKTLEKTGLDGRALLKAEVSADQFGSPQIAFELNSEGAKKFAELTRNNIGKKLAITLDGEVQTAPTINSEIPGGKGVISGSYTQDEAKKLVTLLNAGALPIKAEILEIRAVGATLGAESVAQSMKASILAFALVGIFMIVMYRLPGVLASIALMIFGTIVLGVLNYFGAVLTFPGIAGIILSLGMAVDANVIIFERVKEELRAGNSIAKAIDLGFSRAFSAIWDGNITTLIITAVLFQFGTGAIKGFAITLAVGTLSSMFTAITVTKLLLKFTAINLKVTNLWLYGVKKEAKEVK